MAKSDDKKKSGVERDITSFVTRQMLLGNISNLSIDRFTLENALEKYCVDNPRIDPTAMPLVGVTAKGNEKSVDRAVLTLAKKYCGPDGSNSAVFSPDGNSAIIFGQSAKEIVSKSSIAVDAGIERLKTKIKVKSSFPVNRRMNCFGGEKISDHI